MTCQCESAACGHVPARCPHNGQPVKTTYGTFVLCAGCRARLDAAGFVEKKAAKR